MFIFIRNYLLINDLTQQRRFTICYGNKVLYHRSNPHTSRILLIIKHLGYGFQKSTILRTRVLNAL